MTAPRYRRLERCRICGSADLALVLSLGETPLANSFRRPDQTDPEPRYPLEVLHCGECGLLQLSVVVPPEDLFAHYLYASSASQPMVDHFRALADELARDLLPPSARVVEIGSNDGILLRPLREAGLAPLGVEPAANLAAAANERGAETINAFFGLPVSREIVKTHGRAAAIVANNVLAHVDDIRGVLEAAATLLSDDGILVAEVPYVVDLLDHVEYDTIYHEHLSYFGVGPLAVLVRSAGMELFDVRQLAIHGGSIRIYAGRAGARPIRPAVGQLLAAEAERQLTDHAAYAELEERVVLSRDRLRELLADLRHGGRRVAGYGASAKGNTLLNYCGIGPDTLAFIADTTPQKHGLLTPGTHIPVRPDGALMEARPDFTLLLAWNYADAIIRRHADYVREGGRFIHPIPVARVIP